MGERAREDMERGRAGQVTGRKHGPFPGIRQEIQDIQDGKVDPVNNLLKRAPHTQSVLTADEWDRPYTRKQAGFPLVSSIGLHRVYVALHHSF